MKATRNGRHGAEGNRYEREDWTLFRSIRTISQSSGVPPELLRRLVAKELADNALDVSGACRVGELPDGGFYVEDDGPGIGGDPEEVARLFSFRRPLVSSKVKRLPTRGALGNGLRVVAGAVFASGGSLRVLTRGRALDLSPQESGETLVKARSCECAGTRIEVRLGDGIPEDGNFLKWAKTAIRAAGLAPIYAGKTSPWWYDSDASFELLRAAGERTVRDVMQDFDGYTERAGNIPKRLLSRPARSLKYEEAEQLLKLARSFTSPVDPKQLGLLKKCLPGSYANALNTLELKPGRGAMSAQLPYVVEAWCDRSRDGRDHLTLLVNRTPVTGEVQTQRGKEKADVTIFGCNLGYRFTVGRMPVDLIINAQIPYMPITSNGKEPDLELFVGDIVTAVEAAAKKCQRANRPEDQTGGVLPCQRRGRPSAEQRAKYDADLEAFARRLKEMDCTFDFPVSSRGWCYILENESGLPKGDFGKAQDLINDCRKNGLLPIDFTSEDETRSADNLEECDARTPAEYASALATTALDGWRKYAPGSFWENQPVYIQMVVEKVDLKHLFLPICREYAVPIINSRGWSDLNLRAKLMQRFQEHEQRGRRVIVLCGNDHDPVGLQMPTLFRDHLEELAQAVGWSPRNLTIERFCLNLDFIEQQHLTWIDGLQTGSGKDLGDPMHPQHKAAFVQDYIHKYGKRKVEANALVVRPEAARQLCREAIEKYLDMNAVAAYRQWLTEQQEKARAAIPEVFQQVLTGE